MDEERAVLEEIFGDDFVAAVDPRDGRPAWRVAFTGHGATLIVRLPAGYPDAEAPPTPALEFDQWPAGSDAFARRVAEELRSQWVPGEGCVFQWADHVREALSSDPAELAGVAVASAAGGARGPGAGAPAADADAAAGAGSCTVPLAAAAADAVGPSLQAAGFATCGPGVYSHGDRGATAEIADGQLSITVDGIDTEDLSDWAAMQLAADPGSFGARLVEWVTAQRSAEPGFAEGDGAGEGDGEGGIDFLPTPEELGVTRGRELLVYTWGKALRKAPPADSEHNFNAGILNGRGGGADLRTMNGLSAEVQNNVASCNLFPRWISMVCGKVEHSDCKAISINCTKGRHRSVAAAEILRKVYYPQAVVRHLTIY